MPQVTVYIRADDFEKWKALGKKSEFIHDALVNGRGYVIEEPTPAKQEHKESPATIRNMAEVMKEEEEKLYDPKRPLWSPFGPLPLIRHTFKPNAVADPNIDPDEWIPYDVDLRNSGNY